MENDKKKIAEEIASSPAEESSEQENQETS